MRSRIFLLAISLIISLTTVFGQGEKGVKIVDKPKITLGSTKAVIVGVSDYKNITKLRYAHTDAMAFYNFLVSPAGGSVDPANVKLLTNEKATSAQIFAALDWLVETTKEGENVIFYFSGHGDLETKTIRQNGFLLAYDCPPAAYMSGGTVAVNFLQDYLMTLAQSNKARVTLITDACRSGKLAGGESGAKQTAAALQEQWETIIKILSSQAGELSYEGEKWGNGGGGIFTQYLVNGLTGFGDKNKDKKVTVSELFIYFSENVPKETDFKQNPYVTGNLSSAVAYVDSTSFASLQKKQTSVGAGEVAMRGSNDDPFKKLLDSLTYKKFQSFQACLKNNNLIYDIPGQENAWKIFSGMKDDSKAKPVINEMKNSLCAALQDKSQTTINLILKGKVNLMRDTVLLDTAYRQLDFAMKILDEKNIAYGHIKARYLYMKSIITKQNKEKLSLLDECIALEPDAPHPYNYKATVYRLMRDYKQSIENYNKAILLAPNWSYPYNNLGIVYFDQKEYDKAIEQYNKAISLSADDEVLYSNLGNVYYAKQDYDKAVECLEKAVKIKPSFAFAHNNLGNCYLAKKEYDKAEASFNKAIELNPKYHFAFNNLGNLFLEKKDYEKALTNYNLALQLKPSYVAPLRNIALIYKEQKKFEQSAEYYNKAISAAPESPENYYDLACLYAIQDKNDEALIWFEKAIQKGMKDKALFEKDEELSKLRKTNGYKDLIKKYFTD
ncbi:MAG: tetratricopeptide repeat protein [Bacteroidota bacterium]